MAEHERFAVELSSGARTSHSNNLSGSKRRRQEEASEVLPAGLAQHEINERRTIYKNFPVNEDVPNPKGSVQGSIIASPSPAS